LHDVFTAADSASATLHWGARAADSVAAIWPERVEALVVSSPRGW
jgi:hypothetical protein